MERGYKEVSNNQVGHRRGSPQKMSTTSSLVAAMSAEELRLYSQVLSEISMEMLDGSVASTVGEADNAIYFTRD